MSKTNTTTFAVVAALALGAPFEGGKFAGISTLPDGTHIATTLLDIKPDERMTWQEAMAFASENDAQLPSRPVCAMLFANQREEFTKTWHWTKEQYEGDDSYAWICFFYDGIQDYCYVSGKYSVRLVRSFHLIA